MAITSKSAAGAYIPEFDTLRLLAILSVMCLHWFGEGSIFNRIQGQLSNGVHLFFVLSGYLITGILLRCRFNVQQGLNSRGYSFRQFYIRRFLRIFPVYYFVLALGVLFHFEGLRRGLPWHATYTSNFFYFFRRKFDGPASLFWTLAVEEQFYLFWPLLILTLPRRWMYPAVLLIAIAGTALRAQVLLQDSLLKILTPWCLNFLAMGSLLAVSESPWCGSPAQRQRLLRCLGALSLLLAAALIGTAAVIGIDRAMVSPMIRAISQPMMSMLYVLLLAWASRGIPGALGKAARWSPLIYLGRISYGLYLYHLFVSFSLLRGEPWLLTHLGNKAGFEITHSFATRFMITVGVASVSWFCLEKPLNQLKRYFPYSNAPAQPGDLAKVVGRLSV